MSSNSGANARVLIPSSTRKTIQDIREISGNHSDEDVYAMLKDCSMDPNETAQRLLFLDTFHEVKRKRDKRKDNVNERLFERSRRKPGNQGRVARSGRGSFSSQYTSHDAGGERVATVRNENGLEDKRERGLQSPAHPILKEEETSPFQSTSKTSFAPGKGPTCLPSDGLSNGHVVQNSKIVNTSLPNHVKDAGLIKPETTLPQTKVNAKHAPSADTNLVLTQSHDSQIPNAVGAGKSHDIVASLKDSVIAESDSSYSHEFADKTQTNQPRSGKVDTYGLCFTMSENSEHLTLVQPHMNGESLGSEKLTLSPVSDAVQFSLQSTAGPIKAVEEVTTKLDKLRCAEVQHVILPNHIQVPDVVKYILSFGSLDSRFGVGLIDINSSVSNQNSNQASELLKDESTEEPELCDEGTPTAQGENNPDPPKDVPEAVSPTENNFPAPKDNRLKQETVPVVAPPYPVVQPTPTYGFGFMPPMLGSPLLQIEGLDHQAWLLNSVIGNSLAMSTSTPTPPPVLSPGAVAVSAQSLPVIRQPYPPNYIPYTPYFPPYFMLPTLEFLGHGSFPPNNMYLAAAAAGPGIELSPPYKAGTNLMSQPPSPFGVYGSPQDGYNPSAVVTSGNEPAVLKENNVYLGQQSEGTTVWLPPPGRGSTTLPINPLFNLPPQSPHITISPQSGPGALAAMYHPLQTVASPAAAQPLVQQIESMALPPPNSFHHPPRHQQMNWNGGFNTSFEEHRAC